MEESQLKRGLTVYTHGQYGQYSAPEKRGNPISFKYTVANWWRGVKSPSVFASNAAETNYGENARDTRVNTGSTYALSELHLKPKEV